MPCNLRYLTWADFDEAVAGFEKPICDGFYPLPRGGFPLAVALSHRFGKPILTKPTNMSIIVDDIADSGKQLQEVRLKYGSLPAIVWLKRYTCKERYITFHKAVMNDDWIVFPWENKEKAIEDYEQYITNK